MQCWAFSFLRSDMQRLKLTLPADIKQDQVTQLSEMLAIESVAYSAVQKTADSGAVWHLDWLLEEAIPPETCLQNAQNVAQFAGLDIPHDKMRCWIEDVEEEDWLSQVYQAPEPFSVGPFFIHGPDYQDTVVDGLFAIEVEAIHAFGAGNHGTTKGCLLAMMDLKAMGVCPWNILDMGTGSGILSVASWKLWKTPVIAADIEEEAVRTALQHCEQNDVPLGPGKVQIFKSDGFTDPLINDKGPYELIIANILSGPLKNMADDLVSSMDMNSYAILSGLLDEQKQDILDTYTTHHGLSVKREYSHDGWTTLMLHKP